MLAAIKSFIKQFYGRVSPSADRGRAQETGETWAHLRPHLNLAARGNRCEFAPACACACVTHRDWASGDYVVRIMSRLPSNLIVFDSFVFAIVFLVCNLNQVL